MHGHFISAIGIQVDSAKIEVIITLPIPTKPKNVRYFLCHASYYRHFIKYFSKIARPLYTLLRKEFEFIWTLKCNEAFLQLKKVLTMRPVLYKPEGSILFHIHSDALDYSIGDVLGKKSC